MRADHHWLAVSCLASLCAATAAPAQVKWENHIDASMINEIAVRDDVLYIATFGGLLLYDTGSGQFTQFKNTSGLPSNALTCLTFAPGGEIYLGTEDFGVAKVRVTNGTLTLLRSLNSQIDGIASNTVNSIAAWGDDLVYGSTPGAGVIRNDFAASRFFERDGLPAEDVLDVLPVGDLVWMATDGGPAVLNRLGLIRRPSAGPAECNVIGFDGSRVWVGTDDGVWRLDPSDSSWTDVGPDARIMMSLAWDGTTMWGGSTRNFHEYVSGQTWTQYSGTNEIQITYNFSGGGGSVRMKGLAVMADGDVYLGSAQPTDRRGPNLMRFDGTDVTNLVPDTPAENDMRRLDLDADGALWAAFSKFYVGKLMSTGQWVNYNSAIPGIEIPGAAPSNLGLLADRDGIKWFGKLSSGAPIPLDVLDDRLDTIYTNDTWERLTLGSGGGDGLTSLQFQRAHEDPAGNRWFLSDIDGIHILSRDRNAWLAMTPGVEPRMLSGNVIDVAFGSSFTYVALRDHGIQVWGHGGFDWASLTDTAQDSWPVRVTLPGDLPGSADVLGLELRSDGRLWIATSEGLFRYVNGVTGRIPVYTGSAPGILNEEVNDLVLDHDENLWVATSLGLNRIARADENDIQAFTTAVGYQQVSGLRYPFSIISPLANAKCQALTMHPTRDVLYIGTLGGLSVVDFTPPPPGTTDLSRVFVYPNPVRVSRGHSGLRVGNIDGPVSIDIFNTEGELVYQTTASPSSDEVWDLTTLNGFEATTGTYVVRITGSGGSVMRTVALIR